MNISTKEILQKTHYGLNIYSHILQEYYINEIVIHLSGKQCKPAKNPFNADKPTLNLFNKDWVFYYEDFELPDFKGNPFDFAELHYNLSGDALLQKLNDELSLHIGEDFHFYSNRKFPEQIDENEEIEKLQIPKFSFFKCPVSNISPSKEMNLLEAFELIKSGNYKTSTGQLRVIESKEEARKFKASNFDYVTFSGIFSKRNDNSLLVHSGLLTIDFDHIQNIQELKDRLLADEYFETELMFVSPSGDGLKWVIPIDLSEATHQNFFKAISAYIKELYHQEVDKSGKDISRACFLPFDPEVYINPKYFKQ